jgi:hypothetical protein
MAKGGQLDCWSQLSTPRRHITDRVILSSGMAIGVTPRPDATAIHRLWYADQPTHLGVIHKVIQGLSADHRSPSERVAELNELVLRRDRVFKAVPPTRCVSPIVLDEEESPTPADVFDSSPPAATKRLKLKGGESGDEDDIQG